MSPRRGRPPVARVRPMLTVTIDPDLNDRLRALVSLLPGATLSGVHDELMAAALPMYEDMAESMIDAKRPDGSLDEEKAQEQIAARLGMRMLRAAGLPLPEVQDTSEGGGTAT